MSDAIYSQVRWVDKSTYLAYNDNDSTWYEVKSRGSRRIISGKKYTANVFGNGLYYEFFDWETGSCMHYDTRFRIFVDYFHGRPLNFVDGVLYGYELNGDYKVSVIGSEKVLIQDEDITIVYFNSVAIMRKNDKFGIVGLRNEWVVDPEYDYIQFAGENGLCFIGIFKKDVGLVLRLFNYIDNEFVSDNEYTHASHFSYGLCRVRVVSGFLYHFITIDGEFKLDGKYSDASNFNTEGYACFLRGKELYRLSSNGNILLIDSGVNRYEMINPYFIKVVKDGVIHVYALNGDLIVELPM